jgi:hypothetical protein
MSPNPDPVWIHLMTAERHVPDGYGTYVVSVFALYFTTIPIEELNPFQLIPIIILYLEQLH